MRSNEPMKKFRMHCWRSYYGFYDVEAKNEKEAELKANELLWSGEEMEGIRDQDMGIGDTEKLKQ